MKKENYTQIIEKIEKVNVATEYLNAARTEITGKSTDKELLALKKQLDKVQRYYQSRIDVLLCGDTYNLFTNYESIREAVKAIDAKFENGKFVEWFDLNHKDIKAFPLCVSISQVSGYVKMLHDSYFVAKGIASENKKKRISLAEKKATAKDDFLAMLSEDGKKRLEELLKSGAIK